ncbi:leucine-rich repeat-containing protein 47-like [Lycorma delicatula]|uniref:leucine-rich repeat-containing protein 47-like n=1 Tax=Lycorma delicatula TaxID=130591 RepID=UPI003F51694B
MENVEILRNIFVPTDKYELNLIGSKVAEAIEEGFYDALYDLQNLNYISINADLKELPVKFGKLSNLTCLVLHSNKLKTLPLEISELKKLKLLDVSRNSLETIPAELSKLSVLSTLNLSINNLTSLPSLRHNVKLSNLNLSCNKFQQFPDCCYEELCALSEILLNGNCISTIPGDINKLHNLKTLDVADNEITDIPVEISHLMKLKELNLKGNKLKDNRLKKMVNQCHTKKVIDYIRLHLGKQTGFHAVRKESLSRSFSDDKENKKDEEDKPVQKPKYIVQVWKPKFNGFEVMVSSTVKSVRPGIICCVVRSVTFTEDTMRNFIKMQNTFHDTTCNKRQKASVGTHDLNRIKSPLKYVAIAPTDINFVPLGGTESCTASDFIASKKLEAEQLKKDKKRNCQTGIYKYIYMVDGNENCACLMDADDNVISFPPITNTDVSKISLDTKDMLVEVTSTVEKKVAREIMDKFIKELFKVNIGKKVDDDSSLLDVEEVLIIPEKGPKLHYPFDGDLHFPQSSNTIKKNMF